jgi:prophage regulatory protein
MHDRIIRRPELLALTGLSRSTVRRLENEGGFPTPRRIGRRTVGWLLSEIQHWLQALPARTNGGTK